MWAISIVLDFPISSLLRLRWHAHSSVLSLGVNLSIFHMLSLVHMRFLQATTCWCMKVIRAKHISISFSSSSILRKLIAKFLLEWRVNRVVATVVVVVVVGFYFPKWKKGLRQRSEWMTARVYSLATKSFFFRSCGYTNANKADVDVIRCIFIDYISITGYCQQPYRIAFDYIRKQRPFSFVIM